MEPDRKKQCVARSAAQLTDLRRGSYVSKTALEGVLDKVRKVGMPSTFSRRTQLRARQRVCGEETPYGPCVIDYELPLQSGAFVVALHMPFVIL